MRRLGQKGMTSIWRMYGREHEGHEGSAQEACNLDVAVGGFMSKKVGREPDPAS